MHTVNVTITTHDIEVFYPMPETFETALRLLDWNTREWESCHDPNTTNYDQHVKG